jgi:hypothetical protein
MWQASPIIEAANAKSILDTVVILVSAATGALLGLIGGYLGAYVKAKGEHYANKEDLDELTRQVSTNTHAVEEARAAVARRSDLDTQLQAAVQRFTIAVCSLLHSVCWLTWDATARGRLKEQIVERYDAEIHRLSPRIVGQLAVIAMLSPQVCRSLAPFADRAFRLDAEVGEAIVLSERDFTKGVSALDQCHSSSLELVHSFRAATTSLLTAARAGSGLTSA